MHMHHLNLLAILAAAVSTMVVGFLWYSPTLFAKPWMREMGYDPDDKARVQEMQKSAGPAYLGSFIASLVTAFILAMFMHHMNVQNLEYGLLVGAQVASGSVLRRSVATAPAPSMSVRSQTRSSPRCAAPAA